MRHHDSFLIALGTIEERAKIIDVLLIHSVIGLRPAVLDIAQRITEAGFRVLTPDLYHGRAVGSIDDGLRLREEIGVEVVMARASQAAGELTPGSVYAGFSMGASIAAILARADPTASAALLFHDVCSSDEWNRTTAAQVHIADPDPWVPAGAATAFAQDLRRIGAPVDAFLYPGVGHLFSDPGVADYDAGAAEVACDRAMSFLDRIHH